MSSFEEIPNRPVRTPKDQLKESLRGTLVGLPFKEVRTEVGYSLVNGKGQLIEEDYERMSLFRMVKDIEKQFDDMNEDLRQIRLAALKRRLR